MRTRDEKKPLLTMAESKQTASSSCCGCAKSGADEQYEAMGAPPPAAGCCSGCCGGQQQLTSAQLVASFQRAVEKLQKAIQSTGRQSGGDSAFWIVAQLYAHKDIHSELFDYYDRFPNQFRFYAPQLMNFLLHGASDDATHLEVFLLDRAEKSLLFAHRLQWFLNSYAASNHQDYRGTLSATVAAGLSPTPSRVHDRLSGFYSERSQLSQAVTAQGRAAAGRFMADGPGRLRVAPMIGQDKDGSDASAAVSPTAVTSALTAASESKGGEGGVGESKTTSPEPQHEAERPSSPVHVLAPAASDEYAELPGETPPRKPSPVLASAAAAVPSTLQLAPKPKSDASKQWYNANLMFWDEFLRLSRTLRGAAEEGRNDMLRDGMRSIAEGYLGGGSNRTAAALYVPVGDPHNRIVGVHPDDSFCFKTKERVPIMVVLEVVMQDAGVWGDTKRAALRARRGGSALVAHLAQQERAAAVAGRMQRGGYSQAAAQRRARKAAAAQRSGADAPSEGAPGHRAHGAARHAPYTWGLGDSESSSGDEGGAGGGARPRQASGTGVADIFADARKGINDFGRAASAAFGEMRRRGSDMFQRIGGAEEQGRGGRKSRRKRGRSTTGSSRPGSRAGLSAAAAGGGATGDYSTLVGSSSDTGGRAFSEGGHVSDVSERGHVEMLETKRGSAPGLVQPLPSAASASGAGAGGGKGRAGSSQAAQARTAGGGRSSTLPPRGIKGRRRGGKGGETAEETRPLHTSVGAAVQHLAANTTAGAKPNNPALGESLLSGAPTGASSSAQTHGATPPQIRPVGAPASVFSAADEKSTPVSARANASRDHVMRYGVHKRDTQAGLAPDMQELDEGDDHSVFSDSASDGQLPSDGDGDAVGGGLGMWGTGASPARANAAPQGAGAAAAGASYADAARAGARSLRHVATSSEELGTRNSSTPMLTAGGGGAGVGMAGGAAHVAAGLTDFETAAAGGFSDLDEALAPGRESGTGASPLVSPARGRGTSDVGSVAADGAAGAAPTPHSETHVATVAFKQRWKDKAERIRAASPFGHLSGWRLVPVIIKSHDDLRQEQFASQLLQQMAAIWKAAGVPVWLRPYDILSTDEDGGIIEAVPDTVSLHALKEKDETFTTLDDWFVRYFRRGRHAEKRDSLARQNFARSLAAYSIACYVLQIKDRHNGNILLDANGHVIHIDFGFLFTSSPGGNMNFESAPWKLTGDFVGVLGGKDSRLFKYYRSLCVRAFAALRKSAAKITLLVEMTLAGNSHLPCFQKGSHAVLSELAERFAPQLKTDSDVAAHVNELVDASASAFSTSMYDAFQYYSLGIR